MTTGAPALDWRHDEIAVPAAGHRVTREATQSERAQLASELEILACDKLVVRYTLAPEGKDSFALKGTLEAEVTQACIVTLEPVRQEIADSFDIIFSPPTRIPDTKGHEAEILSGADVEPLSGGIIDVGRIVFELVSAGLDPYPRKPGAEFDWTDPVAEASKAAGGAFAALARLKGES